MSSFVDLLLLGGISGVSGTPPREYKAGFKPHHFPPHLDGNTETGVRPSAVIRSVFRDPVLLGPHGMGSNRTELLSSRALRRRPIMAMLITWINASSTPPPSISHRNGVQYCRKVSDV